MSFIDVMYPIPLAAAMLATVVGLALLWQRRQRLTGPVVLLLGAGMLACALAAGGLRLSLPHAEVVRVLVDESASTRGATYHDEAALWARVRELLPGRRFVIERYAADADIATLPTPAGPTLLFSDGQFAGEAIAGGAVYPVIDPGLLESADARIVEITQERGVAYAVVEVAGSPRAVNGVPVPLGRHRVRLGDASMGQRAKIGPGDLWPENDALEWPGVATREVTRWVSGMRGSPGLQAIAPEALPEAAGGYTSTAVLVLEAEAASRLSEAQQQAIISWVRELAGTLVLVGQTPGWVNLRGRTLEELSPLAVDPPRPVREWVVLLDTSGSMSQVVDGQPQWRHGLAAARAAVRVLPRNDVVRFGTFSNDVRWWQMAQVHDSDLDLPAQFVSRGPTSLRVALEALRALPEHKQREVLLLTDAEIDPAEAIAPDGARVHGLALAGGRGLAALEAMARATGGVFSRQPEPQRWADAAEEVARAAGVSRWRTESIMVMADDPLRETMFQLDNWNVAFQRIGSEAFVLWDNRTLGALWRVRMGNVATVVWPIREQHLAALVSRLETMPYDDRYELEWLSDRVRVRRIDGTASDDTASDDTAGADLMLYAWTGEDPVRTRLAEVTPGVLEGQWPRPAAEMSVVVTSGMQVVGRRVVGGKYPPEFERIGLNREALQTLARRTGGRVVELGERSLAELAESRRLVRVWPALAAAAGLLVGIALVMLRRRV